MFNYGSLYGTWLFAFERFNFIVGNANTNHKSIEIQLMRSVERYKKLISLSIQNAQDCNANSKLHPSWPILCASASQNTCEPLWCDVFDITLPSSTCTFSDSNNQGCLLECYKSLYPTRDVQLSEDLLLCSTYGHIFISNVKYASSSYSKSAKKFGGVMASWDGHISFDSQVKPCKIIRLVKHALYNRQTGEFEHHVFAMVKCYRS